MKVINGLASYYFVLNTATEKDIVIDLPAVPVVISQWILVGASINVKEKTF